MPSAYLREAIGVAFMTAICVTAWCFGDRPVRVAALTIAAAWAVATAGEVILQRQGEPILLGDGLAALGLLRLAWAYHRRWLWLALGIEAALFFLHAAYYPPPALLTADERWANNGLNTAGLAVILVAALTSRRHEQRASAVVARL